MVPSLLIINICYVLKMGFPDGSAGKESAAVRETGVRSLGGEDPLGEGMATHSNIIV